MAGCSGGMSYPSVADISRDTDQLLSKGDRAKAMNELEKLGRSHGDAAEKEIRKP